MNNPYYFRDENYHYKLQSHLPYGFWVGKSDKFQAVWGVNNNYAELIWFDLEGNFVSLDKVAFDDTSKISNELDFDEVTNKLIQNVRQKFGLADETILVKRFWLEKLEAGIEDLTETMKEFLTNSDSFEEEEAAEYKELIEDWKDEQQYVFWWGQDFYVSKEGFVETS